MQSYARSKRCVDPRLSNGSAITSVFLRPVEFPTLNVRWHLKLVGPRPGCPLYRPASAGYTTIRADFPCPMLSATFAHRLTESTSLHCDPMWTAETTGYSVEHVQADGSEPFRRAKSQGTSSRTSAYSAWRRGTQEGNEEGRCRSASGIPQAK